MRVGMGHWYCVIANLCRIVARVHVRVFMVAREGWPPPPGLERSPRPPDRGAAAHNMHPWPSRCRNAKPWPRGGTRRCKYEGVPNCYGSGSGMVSINWAPYMSGLLKLLI